ncbi:MAG TPA: tetratricopeptide repeat protein [Thermodesulfobacteriaceae bacterium]|nr:tetratricopeptide repeat protein [Thermodesulfobacteriaceae bacterium]
MNPEIEDRFADGQLKLMDEDFEESIAIFTEILESDPSCARVYQARAVAKLRSDDLAGAMKDIDEAIKCEPENYRFHYHKGAMLFQHGAADEAVESVSRAIGLAPEFAPAYFLRSKIYEKLGDEESSGVDLNKAITLRKQQTTVVDF